MALGEIPPWLNVGPGDYLRALQAGTQVGLERRRLSDEETAQGERSKEFEEQLGESKSEREARLALAAKQQEIAQQRFGVTTGLRQQAQDLHNDQFALSLERANAAQRMRQEALDQNLDFHKQELQNQIKRLSIEQDANDIRRKAEANKGGKEPQGRLQYDPEGTLSGYTITGALNDPKIQGLLHHRASSQPPPAPEYGWYNPLRWIGMHPHPALANTNAPVSTATSTNTNKVDLSKVPEGRVAMKDPSGQAVTLPQDQVEEAKQQGYTVITNAP